MKPFIHFGMKVSALIFKEGDGFVPGIADQPEPPANNEINLIHIHLPFMLADTGPSECRP